MLQGRKTVTVLGQVYDIEYTDGLDAGDYGETCSRSKKIRVNSRMPAKEQESTLFHELCHAVLGASGVSHTLTEGQEEAIVTALEHGLWPIVKRSLNKRK